MCAHRDRSVGRPLVTKSLSRYVSRRRGQPSSVAQVYLPPEAVTLQKELSGAPNGGSGRGHEHQKVQIVRRRALSFVSLVCKLRVAPVIAACGSPVSRVDPYMKSLLPVPVCAIQIMPIGGTHFENCTKLPRGLETNRHPVPPESRPPSPAESWLVRRDPGPSSAALRVLPGVGRRSGS